MNTKDTNSSKNLQYENVTVLKVEIPYKDKKGNTKYKKKTEVHARLYNPTTKKSHYEEVTSSSIPSVYLPSEDGLYKSYLNERIKLKEHSFDTMEEYEKFVKKIKVETGKILEITTEEGEIFEIPEVIYEDDAHGYVDLRHTYLYNAFPNSVESNHIHRTMFLDIETNSGVNKPGFPHAESAWEEVTMIQMYDNFTKKYLILGRKPFNGNLKDNTKYLHFPKEYDLLDSFLRVLESWNPSIVTGFNSMQFDIPYLTNRISRVMDGFEGNSSELNKKKSYKGMKNVSRLSPLGSVWGKKSRTKDDMDGITSKWDGRLLIDYRELIIKYGWLNLASYSLSAVSKALGLEGKVDHSKYSSFQGFTDGTGYIIPKDPTPEDLKDEVYIAQVAYRDKKISFEELQQVVWNRFVEYGHRDVEILVEIDESKKYLETHQGIAYLTSVTMDDNFGVYNQWASYFYKEAMKDQIVLPLKQQFRNDETPYLAGWTRNVPGKYDWITSFDFASLYPSVYKTWNIGADTLIREDELPQELKDLREKYFTYFTIENLNRNPLIGPLGNTVLKHNGEINDLVDETEYYSFLLENKEEISAVLRKYNVSATPNGFFYSKDKESISSKLLRSMFEDRYLHKKESQRIAGEIEDIKREISKGKTKELEELLEFKVKEKYDHSNTDAALKSMMVNMYGAGALSHNTFTNGRLTNACVTISGRMSNRVCALAANNFIQRILGEEETKELKYISQVDTDSFYLSIGNIFKSKKISNLSNLSNKQKVSFIMKLSSEKIQKVVAETIDNLEYCLNTRDKGTLQVENEVISRGFVSVASKRYFTRVVVNDGSILEEPKMKIVGLSLIGKSTPDYLKKKLKPVLELILDKDERDLVEYIRSSREDFGKVSPIEYVRRVSVNNLDYVFNGLGTPGWKRKNKEGKWITASIGSWSSLEGNKYIEENDLGGKYPPIEAGENIMYLLLKSPNEKKIEKAVAFKDPQFVEDLELDKIVDKDQHFEKDFVKKIQIITDAIGWNLNKKTESISIW